MLNAGERHVTRERLKANSKKVFQNLFRKTTSLNKGDVYCSSGNQAVI